MGYTQRITWEKLRSLDTSTSPYSTGVYTKLGTPLLFDSYINKMVNTSNQLVLVSIDGVTDMDVAPANSFFLYDESKNTGIGGSFMPRLPAGTQIWIKGPGGAGSGLVYFVTQYIIPN
jgi:hypothetical protein